MSTLLEVTDLVKHFVVRKGLIEKTALRAVDGVNLHLESGTTLGIVGESGCGKSTLARLLVGLIPATSGEVRFKGGNVFGDDRRVQRAMRARLQIIFQDPFSSLNPWMTAGELISRPLKIHEIGTSEERSARVKELLELVGLPPSAEARLPHEFSGGQRQRIAIARALATNPDVIVADEPTSALDVSVQAKILNLMKDLQKDFGLSYVFISHDIRVIRHMCDEIAVMYLGEIVERAETPRLFSSPLHPYTHALLEAVPRLTPTGERLVAPVEGDPPSALNPPTGCRFNPRCRHSDARCIDETPKLRSFEGEQLAACHYAESIAEIRMREGRVPARPLAAPKDT